LRVGVMTACLCWFCLIWPGKLTISLPSQNPNLTVT